MFLLLFNDWSRLILVAVFKIFNLTNSKLLISLHMFRVIP